MIGGLFQSTNTWILLSTVICVAIIYKYARNPVLSALDQRSFGIKKQIDDAENLKVEAQNILSEYQRRKKEAQKEADKIIEEAKVKTKRMRSKAIDQMELEIKRLERLSDNRLTRLHREIELKLRGAITDEAEKKAISTLKSDPKKLDGYTDKMIDQALDYMSKEINARHQESA